MTTQSQLEATDFATQQDDGAEEYFSQFPDTEEDRMEAARQAAMEEYFCRPSPEEESIAAGDALDEALAELASRSRYMTPAERERAVDVLAELVGGVVPF